MLRTLEPLKYLFAGIHEIQFCQKLLLFRDLKRLQNIATSPGIFFLYPKNVYNLQLSSLQRFKNANLKHVKQTLRHIY